MSRKILMATALAACLAVLFFAVHAADRNRRADAERTQRGPLAKAPAPKVDLRASYDPAFDPNVDQTTFDVEPPDDPIDIQSYLGGQSVESARIQTATLETADQLLRQAARKDGGEAVSLLKRVVGLKLDDSAESRQLLSDTHLRIAELVQEPSRKQFHLRSALQFTSDSAVRTRIEADIVALGGSLTIPTRTVARDYGADDQCTNSIPVGVPGSVTMSIQPPIFIPGTGAIEDRNFVSFDVPLVEPGNPHDPLIGQVVQITTNSTCATEAECSAPEYDTLLRLYGKCASDGTAELLFQGDDDGGVAGDSGMGWLSALEGRGTCVDETGRNTGERCFYDSECQASQGGPNSRAFCNNTICLPAGTYYVEALGEFGSSPQNFTVNVTQLGTCNVPRGDSYEADNSGVDATEIGWPHSIPGNGNGRANKEIQGHTITAGGLASTIDNDYVELKLSRDELVKISTAVTQPKPSNGYFYRPASQETDTQMHVQYMDGTFGQAGVCNHNSSFRGGTWQDMGCRSTQTNFGIQGLGPDEDPNGCLPGQAPRFFNVPSEWCVPNYMAFANLAGLNVNFPAANIPFIFHDDNNPAEADYGSTIELCLPADGQATQPTNPLVARVTSSAANPRSPLLNYFYEARAQTLTPCTFEREPNQSPFQASPIALNQDVYGIWDSSTTRRTNVITPVRRCAGGTTVNALCYETPRPPGANRWAILDVCGGGGTCTANVSAPSGANLGIRTSSVTVAGFHDFDWWGPWDVPEEADLIFQMSPSLIDPNTDVTLSVRVGPADTDGDGFDDFPIVGAGCNTSGGACDDDDTSTTAPPALFEGTLPPAADYLASVGVPGQNPKYYLVASILTNRGDAGSNTADFYYKLSLTAKLPFDEVEPNNDCATTTQNAEVGGNAWQGSLSPSGGRYVRTISGGSVAQDCDIDAYRISVTENTRILFFTEGDPATTDTAIQLEECGTGLVVACDDDGQNGTNGTYWSTMSGCLPPGDYCLRVRAWSGLGPEYFGLNGYYKLKFKGTAGCDPSSDPVTGDETSSCRVGGSRGPFDTFCDGNSDGYPAFTACGLPRVN
jgi:hypothetical protein